MADSPIAVSADRPATAFLPSDVQLLRDVANTFNPDTFDEHNKLEDLADKIEAVLFPAADRPVENTCTNCDHPVADHCGATSNGCSCCDGPASPRPVGNSELRWWLDSLESTREYLALSRMSLSMGAVQADERFAQQARSRIEELFAAREAIIVRQSEAIAEFCREVERLRAEISHLRQERSEIAQEFGVSTDFDLGEHARVVMASQDDFKAEISRLRAIGEVR